MTTNTNTIPDTHTCFFYGTLLAPPVLYRVIFGTPQPDPLHHPSMKGLVFKSALLRGFRRHRVWGADYPAILPEGLGRSEAGANGDGSGVASGKEGEVVEACVRGTLVSGLTEGDVWRLDVFEGLEYERRRVSVSVLDVGLDQAVDLDSHSTDEKTKEKDKTSQKQERGHVGARMVEAETYVWTNPREELEEEEWDFEEFKRDKMKAWMGDGSTWSGDEEPQQTTTANGSGKVEVDSGFADVDAAVAAQKTKENGSADPTRGRGVNGHISRQLEEANGRPV